MQAGERAGRDKAGLKHLGVEESFAPAAPVPGSRGFGSWFLVFGSWFLVLELGFRFQSLGFWVVGSGVGTRLWRFRGLWVSCFLGFQPQANNMRPLLEAPKARSIPLAIPPTLNPEPKVEVES
jgi:hypothetical protein